MSLCKISVIIFIYLNSAFLFAQAELDIEPNKIEFEDIFNRNKAAFLINKGDETLTIDSLKFNSDLYIIDLEDNLSLPFSIQPGDSSEISVSLAGFYYITVTDTTDTLLVYNNGIISPGELRLKMEFFEEEFGSINGIVTDGVLPVANAFVYFFYNGVYLIDTAETNLYGEYDITLPEGDYTVSVQKESYHLSYYDNTFDPFFAKDVEIESGGSTQIDLTLKPVNNTKNYISGKVVKPDGKNTPNRGVVIIRKGKHVPTNGPQQAADTNYSLVYSGLIEKDGSYKIYMDTSDYYFVQSFTNYFLPGYYNDAGMPSVFWSESDSVLIENNVENKNITLMRDSSYGGGVISGKIIFSNAGPGTDYEGITLISRATYNDRLCSYGFSKEDGTYSVPNIPYGEYIIVAQKIGFENSVSQIVYIDSNNISYTGIDLIFNVTDVEDEYSLPREVELYPGYPNPFNPVTNISFYLPKSGNVKLEVLNILGETVRVLIDSYLRAGKYNYNFTAGDLSSGIYIVTLQTNNSLSTQKIVLLK